MMQMIVASKLLLHIEPKFAIVCTVLLQLEDASKK